MSSTHSTPPRPPLAPTSSSNSIDGQILGCYRIDKTIGQGTYGKVKLAYHVTTNAKYAIKIIEKSQLLNTKQISRLQREIRFLKLLHHPHIVKVYDVIETGETIYIAMEYEAGGELFDYIVAHKRVKEVEARKFFRMVLSAVEYCHMNAVIHRDLKPENLLLDEKKCIKIIDFGFGNNFAGDGSLLDTFCGSPFYAAPEMILGKKYEGPEVDMWSLGVILFALLCGHLPFDDDNVKELYKKIATGSFVCPDYLMPNARHLITRLITVDPKQRATLQEVMHSTWVNEGYDHPPKNYLPERPIIKDPNLLSKELVSRLLAFGYTMEDVEKAFSAESDQSRPNPVRSTYFLLLEMLQREENRQRREKHAASLKSLNTSTSSMTLGKISEGMILSAEEMTGSPYTPQEYHNTRNSAKQRPWGSVNTIVNFTTGTRRLSAPDHTKRKKSEGNSPSNTYNKTDFMIQQKRQVGKFGPRKSAAEISPNPASSLRQQSRPVSGDVRRGSSNNHIGVKVKEELRAVSGWFLNVSTTSNKSPREIIEEISRVLTQNGVPYRVEGFTVTCQVDVSALLGSDNVVGSHRDLRHSESTDEGAAATAAKTKGTLGFQIEVCKVPKMSLYGLNFKRISGGVWNYKKVCNKLLHQMVL